MDMYLAALAYGMYRKTLARDGQSPVPDEDAYYARSTLTFTGPAWPGRLLSLLRSGHRTGAAPARQSRHA